MNLVHNMKYTPFYSKRLPTFRILAELVFSDGLHGKIIYSCMPQRTTTVIISATVDYLQFMDMEVTLFQIDVRLSFVSPSCTEIRSASLIHISFSYI